MHTLSQAVRDHLRSLTDDIKIVGDRPFNIQCKNISTMAILRQLSWSPYNTAPIWYATIINTHHASSLVGSSFIEPIPGAIDPETGPSGAFQRIVKNKLKSLADVGLISTQRDFTRIELLPQLVGITSEGKKLLELAKVPLRCTLKELTLHDELEKRTTVIPGLTDGSDNQFGELLRKLHSVLQLPRGETRHRRFNALCVRAKLLGLDIDNLRYQDRGIKVNYTEQQSEYN